MSGRRSIRRNRALAAMLAVVALALVAVGLPASIPDSPDGAADAQTGPCTDPETPASLDFLLPAWGDRGGWANPQQYETIMGADLDGDGNGELLGRNASVLEVFDWGSPSPGMSAAAPGQWVQSPVVGPSMQEADWWFDPSVYLTLQAADLDGNGDDEVFYRSPSGVEVYDYSGSGWSGPAAGPPFGDGAGGGNTWEPQYYLTIQAADVNGDGRDDIVGRGPDGIESYGRQSGGGFARLETPGSLEVFSNPGGWDNGEYAMTIHTGDLTGNGRAEVLARGPDGLVAYGFTVTDPSTGAGEWSQLPGSQPWTDAAGWDHHRYYSTIGVADLDGDGRDEVFGRGQWGVDVWGYDASTSSWYELVTTPTSGTPSVMTDTQGFTNQAYYSTIQAANVAGGSAAQLLGRWPDGLHVYTLDTASRSLVDTGSTQTQFSDANGWNQPVRYSSIGTLPVVAGQPDYLIGKDATGLRTYSLPGLGRPWVDPSNPYPEWTNPDSTSDLGAAFRALNDRLVLLHAAPAAHDGVPGGLFGAFDDLSWDLGITAAGLVILPPPTGINLTRPQWQEMKATLLEWTLAAIELRSYLFDGAENVSQVIETTFATGGSTVTVDDIQNYFTSDELGLDAILGDLVWGALGALDGEVFGFSGGGKLAWNGLMSMTGAGVSAWAGSTQPNGKVSTETTHIENKLQEAFCAADAYLQNVAYPQIVGGLGLLTAMEQMIDSGVLSFDADGYDPVNAANTATAVWVFQQYSSMSGHGWRTGYCKAGHTCNVGFENVAYPQPNNVGYLYKEVPTDKEGTPNCIFSSGGHVDGWGTLTNTLGVDPGSTLFMPYVPQARVPKAGDLGQPYQPAPDNPNDNDPSTMGILGWRISLHSCET